MLYAAGAGPPEAALAAIARARESRRPTLLVLDDADRAPAEVRAALRELAPALDACRCSRSPPGQEAAALARLEPQESIALEPLDAEAVARDRRASTRRPAATDPGRRRCWPRAAASPRRVHEAASEWARARGDAPRRRRRRPRGGRPQRGPRARGRAGRQRRRAAVDARARRPRSRRRRRRRAVVCPYKGLATFDADDAEYFFGRERLVAELVARLVGAPLLAVVGPSGSGKSSVVRAGLLPALAGGVLPGSEQLDAGADPARRAPAARARARDAAGSPATGTACSPSTSSRSCSPPAGTSASAREFVAALVRAAPRRRRVVVLAVRADFYGRCAAYPELSRLLGANHVLVGPMSRDELRRAIERPAQRVGLSVEPELVDALLARRRGPAGRAAAAVHRAARAVARARRAAPAARRLRAQRRRPGRGRAAGRGRLRRARSRRSRRRRARLLLRLADEDESGAVVRRRIALAELDAERRRRVVAAAHRAPAADGLGRRRRGRARGAAARVAAPARLAGRGRRRAAACTGSSATPRARGTPTARDPGALYRGARWPRRSTGRPSTSPELERDRARVPRRQPRARAGAPSAGCALVLAGVAALLVLAVIAGVVALDQRGSARGRGDRPPRRSASAPRRSPTTTSTARCCSPARAWRSTTRRRRAATCSPRCCAAPGGDRRAARRRRPRWSSIALSPDGRTLAMIDIDGTLSLFDTRTRRLEARETMPGFGLGVIGVAVPGVISPDVLRFSDDGTRLAVGGTQPAVLDVRTRKVVMRKRRRLGRYFYAMRFAADGRTLLAGVSGPGDRDQRSALRRGERAPDRHAAIDHAARPARDPDAHARREARRHHDARPYGDPRRDVVAGARTVARRRCYRSAES